MDKSLNDAFDEYYKCGQFLPDPSIELPEDFLEEEWIKELRDFEDLLDK